MNPKDCSKNGTPLKNGVAYTADKVAPSYNRLYNKVKAFTKKHPKQTVIGMLVLATLNILVMLYVVHSKPPSTLMPKDFKGISNISQPNNSQADFSIPNYLKISKLKDSLDYLMKKSTLTKGDSLLFMRICDEYSKLDPAFFKQVNQALTKKNKNPNNENK